MILLVAIVASWFVWGPLGIIFYMGGLFNSIWVFLFGFLLLLLIPLAAIFLLALALRIAFSWRRLSGRERALSSVLTVTLAAFLSSFGLGFAGMTPSSFDMYLRGFTRYVKARTDVPAIQTWLGTLDPNEYLKEPRDFSGIPVLPAAQPRAIMRLHPGHSPYAVKVLADDEGGLMVRLMWGGGLIGTWGIVVGHREMKVPQTQEPAWMKHRVGSRTEEFYKYGEYRRHLASGAYIWAERE